MNKIMLVIFVFISLCLYNFQDVSSNTKPVNELVEIVQAAQQNHVEIESWIVYVKKNVNYAKNQNEALKLVNDIKGKEDHFTWSSHTEEHYSKEVGVRINKGDIKERMVVSSYKDGGRYTVSVTYKMEGKAWDTETLNQLSSKFNGESVYYTIKGTRMLNENSQPTQLAQNIVETFSAQVIEGLEEKEFVSLSAYNEDWSISIPVGNIEKMNLQVGVRVIPDTKAVNVTIGTPIITSTY